MRDETAAWLDPMFQALYEEGDSRPGVIQTLMAQALMPAAEAGTPMMNWLARYAPDGARSMAIDWIRFGQLLRDKLGWDWYPEEPS
jgi:hypothetical protein